LNLEGRVALLVDDGMATGATMRAAIEDARRKGAKEIVAAAPVVSTDALADILAVGVQVVYLDAPQLFMAVGQFYENFEQTSDEEVQQLL